MSLSEAASKASLAMEMALSMVKGGFSATALSEWFLYPTYKPYAEKCETDFYYLVVQKRLKQRCCGTASTKVFSLKGPRGVIAVHSPAALFIQPTQQIERVIWEKSFRVHLDRRSMGNGLYSYGFFVLVLVQLAKRLRLFKIKTTNWSLYF